MLHALGWHLAPYPFHASFYLRRTARRLEHLACLGLPLENRSVLEVGAGVGDFSHFYMDRGCTVTITDARRRNVRYLRRRYPGEDVRRLDLESAVWPVDGSWDIVHCYGVLCHTGRPGYVLERLAAVCRELLLLETKVGPGSKGKVETFPENRRVASLAVHGRGSRPTRSWVCSALAERFEHVYLTRSQPRLEEFGAGGSGPAAGESGERAVFVACRQPLDNPHLLPIPHGEQRRQP